MESSLSWRTCGLAFAAGLMAVAVAVAILHAGVSHAHRSCSAPARAHAIHRSAEAVVWLRTSKRRDATRKSYFGCAFAKGKTITIARARRDRDNQSEDCGGTSLEGLSLKGARVTYTKVSYAGNPPAYRGKAKKRVNLRSGKRKLLSANDGGECD